MLHEEKISYCEGNIKYAGSQRLFLGLVKNLIPQGNN